MMAMKIPNSSRHFFFLTKQINSKLWRKKQPKENSEKNFGKKKKTMCRTTLVQVKNIIN